MKNIRLVIMVLIIITLTGCSLTKKEIKKSNEVKENQMMNDMVLKINNNNYKISFEDNETVEGLINHMPLELSMTELNGNEYYSYLNFKLKSNSINIKTIKAGDVMLYGNNCLVIFYENFETTYSYTRIGHIDNIDNLKNDLKNGSVQFIKIENIVK